MRRPPTQDAQTTQVEIRGIADVMRVAHRPPQRLSFTIFGPNEMKLDLLMSVIDHNLGGVIKWVIGDG